MVLGLFPVTAGEGPKTKPSSSLMMFKSRGEALTMSSEA